MQVLPNGNVLLSAWELRSFEECVAMGRDPESLSDDQLWSDHIVEIAPDGAGGGKVVWKWCFWDHLVQEHDESKPNFGRPSEHPGRLDVNACPGDTDWIHVNSISYNAELDQILLSSPNFSETARATPG